MEIIEKRLIGTMKRILFLAVSVLLSSCSVFCPCSKTEHDPQFIQIFYQLGHAYELDTFKGTFKKDLVLDGTAKTTMWLTTRDQEIILYELDEMGFFRLQDTIKSIPNMILLPSTGPSKLRIKYKDMDKTVIWFYPYDDKRIDELRNLFNDIIFSKQEYKALPPAKSAYQ